MDVPVQYFQAVIAVETAVTGVLLFQIRFFDTNKDATRKFGADPRLRVLLLIVLTATIFGSLEAIREHWGSWSAVLVTVGLAVSVLPILLRALPPLQRDARTQQRHPQFLDHGARPRPLRRDRHRHRCPSMNPAPSTFGLSASGHAGRRISLAWNRTVHGWSAVAAAPPCPSASALTTRSPENDTPVPRHPEDDAGSRFLHTR
jgi:hypothetical protein